MLPALAKLEQTISALDLSEEQHVVLARELKLLDREFEKQEYKISRIQKDKEVAVNLLSVSVENLEDANRQMSLKNEEIKMKNAALNLQKKLLGKSRKELEANLRELQQSYEALEQFSYIASHDLKTPLRTIAGYSQLLQRRYGHTLDPEAQEFITLIVGGVRYMDEIIRDLLEFSSLSMKKQPRKLANLNEVVGKVQADLLDQIEETSTNLIIEQPLPTLLIHESGIEQVFFNLIGNAIKFRGAEPPVIKIEAAVHEQKWQFSVSDNGVGIDASYANKLFRPFQRLHTDRPGLGMGLATCKKIIQIHNGDIWYQPRPGGGSVFNFTISATDN